MAILKAIISPSKVLFFLFSRPTVIIRIKWTTDTIPAKTNNVIILFLILSRKK